MSKSIKCKTCNTVNWATANECVRCKTAFAEPAPEKETVELPPHVAEFLAATALPPGPGFSRYIPVLLVFIVVFSAAFYAYSETTGFDKSNKTSLLNRMYWGKPPAGSFLVKTFEAQLKCEKSRKEIYPPVVMSPVDREPCLRGNLPLNYENMPEFRGAKRCKDLQKVLAPEAGESESVEILRCEITAGSFEKQRPLDSNGAKKGHPEDAATLFFRATAAMDYVQMKDTWGTGYETHDRMNVSEIRTLLLYWNKQSSRWMPVEGCEMDDEIYKLDKR